MLKLRQKEILALALGAALLLLPKSSVAKGKSYLGMPGLPRGVRNNNPGNLKFTSIPWKGKIPFEQNTDPDYPDGKHEQFVNWYYGVRAMIKDIENDINEDGLNTIQRLISAYAVANTGAYSDYVSQFVGIPKTSIIREHHMYKLIDAMSRWENGTGQIITQEDYKIARSL